MSAKKKALKDEPHTKIGARQISTEHFAVFKKSPKHYEYALSNKEYEHDVLERERFKLAIHTFFYDRDDFYKKYRKITNKELPDQNRGKYTDAVKLAKNIDYRDVTIKQSFGTIGIWEEQYDLIEDVCATHYDNELIRKFYKDGGQYISSPTDTKTTLNITTYVPFIPHTEQYPVFDIALVDSALPYVFTKRIINEGFVNKLVWEMNILQRKNAVIIAIEKSKPYVLQPFRLSQELIQKTLEENRMLLDLMYWCKKRGYYPGYQDFDVLKKLYNEHSLGEPSVDIHQTFEVLDQMWELSSGFASIDPPYYMK